MADHVEIQRNKTTGEMRQRVNGGAWQPYQPATPVSSHEPDTWMGGFTKHLLEDEPAARNALLGGAALVAPEVTAASAAVPFVGRGLSYLSKMFRGENPLPSTGAELATDLGGDALESAATVYGGPLIAKGARMVGAAKNAVSEQLPAWARSLAHASTVMNPKALAMDAATSKPVLGALENFGDQFTPAGARRAFGSVAEGMTPGYASMDTLMPSHDDLLATGSRRYAAGRAQQRAASDLTVREMPAASAEHNAVRSSLERSASASPYGNEFQTLMDVDPSLAADVPPTGVSPSMHALLDRDIDTLTKKYRFGDMTAVEPHIRRAVEAARQPAANVTAEVLPMGEGIGERLSDGSLRSPESVSWENTQNRLRAGSAAQDSRKLRELIRKRDAVGLTPNEIEDMRMLQSFSR